MNKQHHPKHKQTSHTRINITTPSMNKHRPKSMNKEHHPSHEQTKDPRTTWPKNETNPQINITTYLKKCRQTGHASCRSRCIAKDFCLALNVNNVDYTCHALYFEMRCKLGFLFFLSVCVVLCLFVYLFIYFLVRVDGFFFLGGGGRGALMKECGDEKCLLKNGEFKYQSNVPGIFKTFSYQKIPHH